MKSHPATSVSGVRAIALAPFGALSLCAAIAIGCSSNAQTVQPKEPSGEVQPTAQPRSPSDGASTETLHSAALRGDAATIAARLEAGADVNRKDQYGSTPLMVAVTFGRVEASRALIDAGADLTLTNGEGSSPLHVAAFLCRTEIVEALLAAGADRTATNNAGRTPLDSVSSPFDDVQPIYDKLSADLAPLGFSLDYEHLKQTRPKIAAMLRE